MDHIQKVHSKQHLFPLPPSLSPHLYRSLPLSPWPILRAMLTAYF
nr:MAG TPA: hypothetical protein [Caudoviricetes sp.]